MKYFFTFFIFSLSITLFAQGNYSDTIIQLQKNQSVLLKKMFNQREKLMKDNVKLQRLQQEKLRIHREMAEVMREDNALRLLQDEYRVLEAKKRAQIELETGKKIELKGDLK